MSDVEVRKKVEVLDPFIGQIVCQVKCSIDLVSLPPVPHRSVPLHLKCISGCVMVLLRGIMTTFLLEIRSLRCGGPGKGRTSSVVGHAQCRGCLLADLALKSHGCPAHTVASAGTTRTVARTEIRERWADRQTVNKGPWMRWNRTHTAHHLCAGLLVQEDTGHDHAAPGPTTGQTRINSGIGPCGPACRDG